MERKHITKYFDVVKAISYDQTEFITTYSNMYTKGVPCLVPNVKQTDEKIEGWILEIAAKKKWDKRDVFNIFAWKTGKILSDKKTAPYSKIEDLKYAEGCDPKNMIIKAYSEFSIQGLAEYIVGNLDELKKDAKNGCGIDAFIKIAENCNCNEIGTVYILTLLFFLSNKEQPIYDTYVMRALRSFDSDDIKPGSKIKGMKAVPRKTETEKVKEFYSEFKSKLEEKFGTSYKIDRKVDQALWVYGHYFTV